MLIGCGFAYFLVSNAYSVVTAIAVLAIVFTILWFGKTFRYLHIVLLYSRNYLSDNKRGLVQAYLKQLRKEDSSNADSANT